MNEITNIKIQKELTGGSYLLSLIAINIFIDKISYSSFSSLWEVLNHCESKIQLSPSLDSSLRNKIYFQPGDKKKIIAFHKTLTDLEYTKNERYSM